MRAETPGAAADADPVSGEIARGELFPALEAAAFPLPVGGVSEPVQSVAGFHLVQVTEKTPAYEPQLEDVRASIEQKIAERKTRERYDAWLKQVRSEAIVEIRYWAPGSLTSRPTDFPRSRPFSFRGLQRLAECVSLAAGGDHDAGAGLGVGRRVVVIQ